MSWNPALAPQGPDVTAMDAFETLIIPRARDLGGFEVRRALLHQIARWSVRSSSSIRPAQRNS